MDDIVEGKSAPEELTRAFAILLYGFLQVFDDPAMIAGSVARRLRRL
jgi:hypothetical protein